VRRTAFPLLVLIASWVVSAQSGDVPQALARKEAAARKRVATDLFKLARFGSSGRAYSDACAELRRALVFHPGYKAATRELKRIADHEDRMRASFRKRYESRRTGVYRSSAKRLAKVALLIHQKGHALRYESLARLCALHFGRDAVVKHFRAVWFKPYLTWVHPAEARKLEAGEERIDGRWLKRAEVQKLNEQHGTWENPWKLSDDVHELTTTVPLRSARHLLGHVAAFREFLLGELSGWDLRPPEGKLPVIVTRTQAEMQAQMNKATGGAAGRSQGAAFYLQSNTSLNPCFVTLEPRDATGQTFEVKVDEIHLPLQHEITHQIAFEYSKYDYDRSRTNHHQFWCVEALANYFEYFEIGDKGDWRLTRRKLIRMGGGYTEGAFAHCKANLARLPTLERLFGMSHREFSTVENYHLSAAVAYFFFEGAGGRYRRPFLRLLETVHKVKETGDTFDRLFKDVDRKKLQAEFEAFVRKIEIED
jgi:hypothetical protein